MSVHASMRSSIHGAATTATASRFGHWPLALVIVIYLLIALAYASSTPAWQNPDEPAHYNYARAIADTGRLPVLVAGDYDQAALERLKASRFAGDPDIARIRYENYQPPLYYLTGGVLLALTPGTANDLWALRTLSLLLGALVIVTVYAIGRAIFPDDPMLALAAAGLVAFIPQHLAMSAAANNDVLGELILALIVLLGIRRIRGLSRRRFVLAGAALLGMAILSKVTAYSGAVILALAELGAWRLQKDGMRDHLRALAGVAGGALLVGGWWLVRNALTYGNLDILGTQRHDLVVVGQPRTLLGADALRHFVVTTFQSFWAVFGWMGVPVDTRIYALLALLTVALLCGLAIFAARHLRSLVAWQHWALLLLLAQLVMMLAVLVVYNVTYVQPQGRYLFPASAAIGVCFALGWRELLRQPFALAAFLAGGGVLLFVSGQGAILVLAGAVLAAAAVAARSARPDVYAGFGWAGLLGGLALLDIVCLVQFILPALAI